MVEAQYYTDDFYNNMHDGNTQTAKVMMPSIINFIKPRSVVDVGCGRGIFLKEVKEVDAEIQILGIDGDYIDRDKLLITEDEFYAHDLSKKIELKRVFDLAISLEVAEHLTEEYADTFVDNLVKLSDKIVFSAAVPGQGGTHHVNEQWMSYWKKKFEERGYMTSFCFRNLFWENKEISPLRRQNIMFYVKKETYDQMMTDIEEEMKKNPCDIIHPEFWVKWTKEHEQRIKGMNTVCLNQSKIINCIIDNNFDSLIEYFSKMNLFELADNINLLEYIKRVSPQFFDKVEFEIDSVSKKLRSNRFIIYGAGEDGRKIKELFEVMNKNIVKVCDKCQKGSGIISVEEMINAYAGKDIIVLASRKYREDMMRTLHNMSKKKFLIY